LLIFFAPLCRLHFSAFAADNTIAVTFRHAIRYYHYACHATLLALLMLFADIRFCHYMPDTLCCLISSAALRCCQGLLRRF